jgi:hypothetical protein
MFSRRPERGAGTAREKGGSPHKPEVRSAFPLKILSVFRAILAESEAGKVFHPISVGN